MWPSYAPGGIDTGTKKSFWHRSDFADDGIVNFSEKIFT